ncbi:MAG: biotin--[acetyl-CoA-carboxylase] ligase [Planctomycetes bacterium RBG_13_62_9]|nr:MAG: biotin--[acetyl-CoA-carboxylase] ligase [Planctomycetes bacterium RBG_13_62_9]
MPVNDRLDPDLIQANLRTQLIGRKVLVYDQTSSTNDVAAEYARNPGNSGLVVFAEEQTAGRGRTGAKWLGKRGDSLLFSFVLADCDISGELLPLTCAVAVAEAIGQVGPCHARIKWPNDILLDGKKVAGILVESRRDPWPMTRDLSRESHATSPPIRMASDERRATTVVGIGINCHQTTNDFPPDLRETATSLDQASGTRCHRVTVARRVLTSLDHWLRAAQRDSTQIIETWRRLSTQLGQRLTLSYDGKRFTGHCIGIDPEKGLILQLDRGGVRMFDAAHTHIAK